MISINGREVESLGLAAIEDALEKVQVLVINDDGRKFVVMTPDHYEHLLESDLLAAVADTKDDLAAGRFSVMTADEHVNKLSNAEAE